MVAGPMLDAVNTSVRTPPGPVELGVKPLASDVACAGLAASTSQVTLAPIRTDGVPETMVEVPEPDVVADSVNEEDEPGLEVEQRTFKGARPTGWAIVTTAATDALQSAWP
jgi:hypothetical protein